MSDFKVKIANEAFKRGDYELALGHYVNLSRTFGDEIFKWNIDYCKSMLKSKADKIEQRKKPDGDKGSRSAIRIAAIMDEFSWDCWKYESDFSQISLEKWQEDLESCEPDFLFVESAWKGNDGQWQYRISNSKRTPSKELVEVLNYCKFKNIPTIFWNKEDPIHYDHFINTAKLFDIILTTDSNCIPKYIKEVGHSRVHTLMFAAQPILHNPSQVKGYKSKNIAFAGAWYHGQHDQRAQDMQIILDVCKDYGLDIYDRNHGKIELEDKHGWPHKFKSNVVGGVPYTEIPNIYKRYKLFANVNSVVDSPTMFSRRVFELLACGTPVVSTKALGIEKNFSADILFCSNNPREIRANIEHLLKDQQAYRKACERGIIEVMSRHTYGHRLAEVIGYINSDLGLELKTNLGRNVKKINGDLPPNSPIITVPPPRKMEDLGNHFAGLKNRHILVAAIIDEIFEPYFEGEFELVKFAPYEWDKLFGDEKPAFALIDSAWHGNDGSWSGLINRHGTADPSKEFSDFISWCKYNKIITVFWSREDPPNFDIFLPTAKLCDFVYTTDLDCVPRYKDLLGSNNVGVLPFFVQPRFHNPIDSRNPKFGDVVFAGTWYDNKHDGRKIQMENIVAPCLPLNLHIYDRMLYFTNTKAYQYPENYKKNIVGSLGYRDIMEITKRYKVMLNVNSVTESPTMCSCRITESLMAGTAVVSGYARGTENLIGSDLVPMPNVAEKTVEVVEKLLNDDILRERIVRIAQRRILANHTAKSRVNKILTDIGLKDYVVGSEPPLVSVIISTNRPSNIFKALENFSRQNWPNKELILGIHGSKDQMALIDLALKSSDIKDIKVLYFSEENSLGAVLNTLIKSSNGEYVAKMDDDDMYFPNYLTDQMSCFEFTEADVIGKHSFFVYVEAKDNTYIRFPGREHKYINFISGATLLFRRKVHDMGRFPNLTVGEDGAFLELAIKNKFKIYSSDKFNFMYRRSSNPSSHTWKIDLDSYMNKLELVSNGMRIDYVEC